MIDDERDREQVREFLAEEAREMKEERLDDAQVAALVSDELGQEERDQMLKSLARSPDAIRRYRRAMDRRVEGTPSRWRRTLSYPRIAACTLLAIAFAPVVWFAVPEGPVYRAASPRAVVPIDNSVLDAFPHHFGWDRQAGAERYRVLLHHEERGMVWTSDWTSENTLDARLPQSVADNAERQRFYWIVETDGAAVASSIGPFWFSIGSDR